MSKGNGAPSAAFATKRFAAFDGIEDVPKAKGKNANAQAEGGAP
jgi:hypothetical protein